MSGDMYSYFCNRLCTRRHGPAPGTLQDEPEFPEHLHRDDEGSPEGSPLPIPANEGEPLACSPACREFMDEELENESA